MRRAVGVAVCMAGLTLLSVTLPAQNSEWNGQVQKGDLGIELGAGFGSHGAGFGYGVALVPGVEWILADWKVAGTVPLAFGVAAKGSIELIPATGVGFGADALVTFHLGFGGLGASEFFQKVDLYTAMGVGFVFIGEADVPFGMILPAVHLGSAWYSKETLAIYVEIVYRHGLRAPGYAGGVVGVRLLTS